jgi:ribosomal protein S21
MAVIVHNDMPIDQALKMLWREANREDIPKVLQRVRYRIKPTSIKHESDKVWGKMKRRRRTAKRRLEGKNKTFLQVYYK